MEERGLTGATSTAPVPLLPDSGRAGEGEGEKTPRPLFRLPVSPPPSGLSPAFPSLVCLPVSVLVPPIGQTKLQPDVTLGLGVCRPQPPGAHGGQGCGQWVQRGTGDQTAQTPVL